MIKHRNIKYGFYIIYNLIRLPIKSLFYFGRFHFDKIQLIRPGVQIVIEDANSGIKINKTNILDGTLLHAEGGIISIGKGVFINRNCNIIAKKSVEIGDRTTIGPNVCIYDHDHTYGSGKNEKCPYKVDKVVIGKNVWIGANVIILRGAIIQDNCVIGAGSIIKGEIPTNTMVIQKKNLRFIDIG